MKKYLKLTALEGSHSPPTKKLLDLKNIKKNDLKEKHLYVGIRKGLT